MSKSLKVAFQNLGCRVNEYETEKMAASFKEHGYETVPFKEGADVYIINTCTVTNIADRKSRQMLHRAKKMNNRAVVVAAGCYVNIRKEELEQDSTIDILIENKEKPRIYEIVTEFMNKKEASFDDMTADTFEKSDEKVRYEHCRAFMKIQDGCNMFCTYCIIPYARGRVTSRPADEVIAEAKAMAEAGCREIVLSGIHISSYGIDFTEIDKDERKDAFINLIESLHKIDSIERIRLGSLEPRIMTEEFTARLSKLEKFCPQFHLSMQSGCDETLKRMNRHYDSAEYYEICERIRRYFNNPAITTDIITGFPGETEEEFEASYNFTEKVHFSKTHVFKYSKRNGTVAADMPCQLTDKEKSVRSDRLLKLDALREAEYAKSWLGKSVEVLFEEQKEFNGKQMWHGSTKEYVSSWIKSDEDLTNRIFKCRGIEVNGSELICEMIE